MIIISVVAVFQMMELLKEQLFQKQVAVTEEEEEEEEAAAARGLGEGGWGERRRGGPYRPRGGPLAPVRLSASSWAELPRLPQGLRGRHSSSTSHLPLSPGLPDSSYEQVRHTCEP